jgi:hypothetical protein
MLKLIRDYLKENADNIKNLDTASQQSLQVLAENIAMAAKDSFTSLGVIGTKIGEAATNIGGNGESLDKIADKIEGNNGELNFILKNMTKDVSDSIKAVEAELKSVGASLVGSLDGGTEKVVTGLEELERIKVSVSAGLALLSSTTETAGSGARAALEAVAGNILSSITALETELVSSLDTGNTKVATSVDGTKTALDTIKQALDMQNDKLDGGLSLMATNIAKSGTDNKAG